MSAQENLNPDQFPQTTPTSYASEGEARRAALGLGAPEPPSYQAAPRTPMTAGEAQQAGWDTHNAILADRAEKLPKSQDRAWKSAPDKARPSGDWAA